MTRVKLLTASVVAATATLAPLVHNFAPKLVYNPSASAPVGLYWMTSARDLERGGFVVVSTPPAFKSLAAERGYLPENVPLIKTIVALEGDQVCRNGEQISMNGRPIAVALKADNRGRKLPVWTGCIALGRYDFFALMDAPDSFDSRYFGPLDTRDIIGQAIPMWIRRSAERSRNSGEMQQ